MLFKQKLDTKSSLNFFESDKNKMKDPLVKLTSLSLELNRSKQWQQWKLLIYIMNIVSRFQILSLSNFDIYERTIP